MAANDSNAQVLTRAVEALTSGDMAGLAEVLNEDFVVHVPGSNQLSGVYKSRDEFFNGFLGKIMALTDGRFTLEPHDILGSADHAVGVYTFRATRGEKTFEWRHVNVYHVRGGRLSEVWQSPHDFEAWNAFWS
jgi:ketosteroid isomerase-like protein